MKQSTKWSLWNGDLVSHEQGVIPSMDRGLLLGDGVFDTLLIVDKQPLWGELHFARLCRHGAAIGLEMPWDRETWLFHLGRLLEAQLETSRHWILRTTLTRGVGERGLLLPAKPSPNVLMTIAALSPSLAPAGHLMLSSIQRNASSPTARIKSLGLLDAILAREKARQMGFDDAVFCNHLGALTCCTSSNLFLLSSGVLKTPALTDGVMDGVTRSWVLECAKKYGVIFEEVSLFLHDLVSADLVFSTNAVQGPRLFSSFSDGEKQFSYSTEHPSWEALQRAWKKALAL
ncbi:MAG: aminotransferase class IV [Myxococcales bacterium]|nr:aminotransferase class IV [Myxococcales bacterium]